MDKIRIRFNQIILISITVILAACNYTPLNINSAEIIINTGMDLSESKALASDVASFKLTVTADGMTTIERNFTEQEFSLDIEAGPARTFMLEALDSSGNTLFSGSSTVDLTAGETVDVVINMDYSGFYVNFETNGGTAVSTHYVAAGDLLTEPDSPARYGFSLTGWYTDAALTTSWDFLADAVSSDMTLYAKWNALPVYTVTFDSNGGDAVAPQNILQGEKVIEPDAPSQSGKTFNGWYSDAGLNNPWIFSADAVTVNITLYAGWLDIPSYTVTYNSNGGSAVSEQTNILENSTTSAPEAPTKAGYAFDGWFTDDGLWTDEWIFISDTVTADIELFAKWNIETYSITYNLDGGTGNSNPSTYDVETATITLTSVTKSNYEFDGWFSDAGFTSPISEITIGSSGNVEVYAYWTPTQYTITYNLNGGSNNVGNPATYTVETQTITLEDPSRSGYTFDGWFTDAGLTTSISEIPLGTAGDVTVYAAWDVIPVYDISVLGGFSSYITPLLDANSLSYTTGSEYVAGSNVYIVTSGTSDTVFQTLLDNNCNIMIDAYFADNSALFETLYGATNYSMGRYNSVITDNTHYITTGYSGTIEFSSSGGRIVTVAPGAFTELMNYSGQPSLGYIDGSGKIVYGGVFFIYNEDFPDYASTEAKEIFIRSLDWLAQ